MEKCRACGETTDNCGTKLCDFCWEVWTKCICNIEQVEKIVKMYKAGELD